MIGAGGLVAGLILGSPLSRRLCYALWHRKVLMHKEKIKLVIVVRSDLGMSPGKVAAQCAHAAVISYCTAVETSPKLCQMWMSTGQQKVVLRCNNSSEATLLNYVQQAKSKGLLTSTVIDAGHTQVLKGSLTVAGIGPGPESLINEVTGKLKVY